MLILSNIWSLANIAFASITTSSHWHSISVCFGQEASDTDSCYFRLFHMGIPHGLHFSKVQIGKIPWYAISRLEIVLRTSIDKSL